METEWKCVEINGNAWKMEREMEPEEQVPLENKKTKKCIFVKKDQADCTIVYENDTMRRAWFCLMCTK